MPSMYRRRLKLGEAQNWRCCWCGTVCDPHAYNYPHMATIEHVIPIIRGGSNTVDNMAMACHRCNSVRGNDSARTTEQIIEETVPSTFFAKPTRHNSTWPVSKRKAKRMKRIRRYIKKANEFNENGWFFSDGTPMCKEEWFRTLGMSKEQDDNYDAVYEAVFGKVEA